MDRQNRREFLRKGAAAGVIVAGLPLVRTFDVPAFGQAGSPPVPTTSHAPDVAPEAGAQGGAGGGGTGAGPGAAVAGRQVTASGSLPFTGGDPKNAAIAGAGAVALGTVMVGRPRRSAIGRARSDARTERSLARLDKVFWGFESPVVHALGFPFRVRHTSAPEGPALMALLAPFRTASGGDADAIHELAVRDRGVRHDPRFAVYLDGRLASTAGEPWAAISALFSVLDRAAVERASVDHLVVHASAAGHADNSVILVGPSGSGKTTVATALVRDGLGYVADEVVAIEAGTLRISPYQKPLTLKPGSHHVFPELRGTGGPTWGARDGHWHVPAAAVRAGSLLPGGMARCVVAVEHRAGVPSALEPMTESDTVSLLVQQCFNGDRLDERGLATAVQLASEARCYRLRYSDTDTACALVRRALADTAPGRPA